MAYYLHYDIYTSTYMWPIYTHSEVIVGGRKSPAYKLFF